MLTEFKKATEVLSSFWGLVLIFLGLNLVLTVLVLMENQYKAIVYLIFMPFVSGGSLSVICQRYTENRDSQGFWQGAAQFYTRMLIIQIICLLVTLLLLGINDFFFEQPQTSADRIAVNFAVGPVASLIFFWQAIVLLYDLPVFSAFMKFVRIFLNHVIWAGVVIIAIDLWKIVYYMIVIEKLFISSSFYYLILFTYLILDAFIIVFIFSYLILSFYKIEPG